ncbi:MAG: UDP-2,3-diacylglucosamine diphosphatase [Geminicoccaceae bacterium]
MPTACTVDAPAHAVDTLIVSDVHLGLPASRPRDLLAVLEQWRFERLILLGDIFHDWSFRHLCADTWRLLAHIHRLKQRSEAEIVWVLGNHDRHLAHLVAKLVGVETTESFRWRYDGRSFMALHGDRFDSFISTYERTSAFFSTAYAFTQRWLSRRGEWPKRLDRAHIGFSNLSAQIEAGARGYATENEVDVIVCGHTHQAMRSLFAPPAPGRRPIEYLNTGCWVDRPASFVTVGAGGVALNHCP